MPLAPFFEIIGMPEPFEIHPKTWIYLHPDQLRTELHARQPGVDSTHNSSAHITPDTVGYIFVESAVRWSPLPFHKKRIVLEISAMRHLAMELRQQGHPVVYLHCEDPFETQLAQFATKLPPDATLHLMEAASFDERKAMRTIAAQNPAIHLQTNRYFLATPEDYTAKITPGYRMEYFYRDMRRQTGLLMDGQVPAGGEWNFDKENRRKLPRGKALPKPPQCHPDTLTAEVIAYVTQRFPYHYGDLDGFSLPVTRSDAERLADHFFDACLAEFGPYEDAMSHGQTFVFHSLLSPCLNLGLLDPLHLCQRAEAAWKQGSAPLQSVEGFIRQIIGWREFIRIYYEARMPDVREANHFGYHRGLPRAFWSADSGMTCIDDIITSVRQHAYSHHITRLMVLSNFANLTETNPRLLYEWFWYAYADAHDWVVLPNVLGMSTFADGGILASKPYVSGGNYIHKMSDYCGSCRYKIAEKTGPEACPFNYLYWNFVDRHRDVFNENGRVSFMVNMFDKKSEPEKTAIRDDAATFTGALPRWQADRYTANVTPKPEV
jgi:deoxyribodipyrimidine photolyase-related protein